MLVRGLEIGLGLGAFALLCLYDFLKMKSPAKGKPAYSVLFFGAVFLLVFATAKLTDFALIFKPGQFPRQVLFVLAIAAFAAMAYALFFALPFSKTYIKQGSGKPQVVSSGLYALCRHPGVLFFILGYFFLWLASGGLSLFLAFLLWSMADILHVYWQDRYFFPPILEGYDRYQNETPFLLPSKQSLRAFRQGRKFEKKEGL